MFKENKARNTRFEFRPFALLPTICNDQKGEFQFVEDMC